MTTDPRNIKPEQIGTRIRDAAADPDAPDTNFQIGTRVRDASVDPRPGDHLGPSNAGKTGEEGNPHGPNVISPGLPDNWPTYAAWRQHVIDLTGKDPGPGPNPLGY